MSNPLGFTTHIIMYDMLSMLQIEYKETKHVYNCVFLSYLMWGAIFVQLQAMDARQPFEFHGMLLVEKHGQDCTNYAHEILSFPLTTTTCRYISYPSIFGVNMFWEKNFL